MLICELLNQDGTHDPLGDAGRNRLHLEATTDELMLQYHRATDEAGGDLTVAPSRAQARAEGLGELCERAAGVDLGATRAPEPEVIVQFNAETGALCDAHGERLDPQLMRWLISAAVIRPLETSGNGDALRMGRVIRYANRHMRRALTIRDGGCIFPGWTMSRRHPPHDPTMVLFQWTTPERRPRWSARREDPPLCIS